LTLNPTPAWTVHSTPWSSSFTEHFCLAVDVLADGNNNPLDKPSYYQDYRALLKDRSSCNAFITNGMAIKDPINDMSFPLEDIWHPDFPIFNIENAYTSNEINTVYAPFVVNYNSGPSCDAYFWEYSWVTTVTSLDNSVAPESNVYPLITK
jgi:hypothetical protein